MFCSREASRVVLIGLNVIIIMTGVGIGVAGVVLRTGSGFLSDDAVKLLNDIDYDNVKLGTAGTALYLIMIICGGLIAMVGLFGVCGGWHSVSCCLVVYVIIVVVLAMAKIAAVGVWISVWGKTDEWIRGQLLNLLKKYQGPTSTDYVSKGFNSIFIDAKCCGVSAQYEGSNNNNDFSALPATWWASRGSDYLPATCCQGVEDNTISSYTASDDCGAVNPPINFYSTGCYNRLVDTVKAYSILVIVLGGVAFVLEMIAIWTSCVLLKRNDNKIRSTDTAGKNQPSPYVGMKNRHYSQSSTFVRIDHVLKKKGRA